ncbi:hypothetical protein PT974_07747 [Cladobotryum mycophilum]|uniref:Uncharacterized protein n=1 Tax=Cladobotryum mycophilum TaxID=491253 RepID=A0ABR0SI67_9HYPO
MVIGLLAIAAIPTVTGVGQGYSAQKRQNAAAKEQEKFRMTAICDLDGQECETSFCVLKDKRLIVNLPGDDPVQGHFFCGYYFTYPSEEKHRGMVSTISEDPPMLNWIYVNKDTHAVEFGGRKDTIDHVIGPWGWSEDETFLTLQGRKDDFVARWEEEEEEDDEGGEGRWVVYWDPGHEMLAQVGDEDCMVVRLRRRPLLGMDSRYVRD